MFCCRGEPVRRSALTIHTMVTDALTDSVGGTIRCEVSGGVSPVYVEWFQNGGAALLDLDAGRTEATNVPPGTYQIVARDGTQAEVTTRAVVGIAGIPSIVGYDVTHATSDTARDGMIVARTKNLRCNRFLWTSGVVTTRPELLDVRPGMYTMTPLSHDAVPILHLHVCEPAVLHASRLQNMERSR